MFKKNLREILSEFIRFLKSQSGEGSVSDLLLLKELKSIVKIGKTIYRLTSKFEGNKDLDETLKRLAIKQVTKVADYELHSKS